MTKAQMSELYRDLMYEHIYLLNIEGKFTYRCEQETATIIDSDFCRIDIG